MGDDSPAWQLSRGRIRKVALPHRAAAHVGCEHGVASAKQVSRCHLPADVEGAPLQLPTPAHGAVTHFGGAGCPLSRAWDHRHHVANRREYAEAVCPVAVVLVDYPIDDRSRVRRDVNSKLLL